MTSTLRRACIAAALACFAALLAPGVATAAFPGVNGKIVFDDNGDIYTINPDWTGRTNLTSVDPAYNSQGAWSPDGRKIAFTRDVVPSPGDPSSDIYVMNADGTGLTQLASGYPYSAYSDPTWSPDGSKIAFVDGYGTYVMNADGSNQSGGGGVQPDWSPDGTKIAFAVFNYTEGIYGPIYTMNPDGSDVTQVTDPLNDGCFPSEYRDTTRPTGLRTARRSHSCDTTTLTDAKRARSTKSGRSIRALPGRGVPSWSPTWVPRIRPCGHRTADSSCTTPTCGCLSET